MLRDRRRPNLSHCIRAVFLWMAHDLERLIERAPTSLTPKFAQRHSDFAVAITQAVIAIAREKQRSIKIDIIGGAGENARRRHAQRSSDHATDEQFKSALARSLAQAQRFGESASFIELHVDDSVPALETRKICARVAAFD